MLGYYTAYKIMSTQDFFNIKTLKFLLNAPIYLALIE